MEIRITFTVEAVRKDEADIRVHGFIGDTMIMASDTYAIKVGEAAAVELPIGDIVFSKHD